LNISGDAGLTTTS
jgi:hypothetical protein